ncbi:hypothetical protein AV530_014013 [Patagioenas fasciata monilis]|uniref:RNase H type-1 domain-containing protein n=1 Tax=Patagioenas fasciata monilis TaxID=372326 RepID=A0A1V4K2Z8_PATFA|nr:hypothetical protein AV530_014013 [Patagioenas fasciata monilis]
MGKTYAWKKDATCWTVCREDLRTILLCLVTYWQKHLRNLAGICDCVVPVTVLLIQEARKLTLGQQITVFVPHAVALVLEQQGHHCLSPGRVVQYQVPLLEQDDVSLKAIIFLNPAILLPVSNLVHDRILTIEQVFSSRPDLRNTPLEDPEWTLYADGSNFALSGERPSGYAVLTLENITETEPLSSNTSAQKAELIVLTRA